MWFQHISYGTIGGAAFLIPVFLLLHAIMHKRNVQNRSHYYKWAYTVVMVLISSMFIHTVVHGTKNDFTWSELFESGKNLASGGGIGGGAAQLLNKLIGPAGVIIFSVIALVVLVSLVDLLGTGLGADLVAIANGDDLDIRSVRGVEERLQKNGAHLNAVTDHRGLALLAGLKRTNARLRGIATCECSCGGCAENKVSSVELHDVSFNLGVKVQSLVFQLLK